MASTTRTLVLQTARSSTRASCRRIAPRQSQQWQRSLSTTAPRYEDDKPASTPSEAPSEPKKNARLEARPWDKGTAEERTAARLAQLKEDLKMLDPDVLKEAVRTGKRGEPWRHTRTVNRGEIPQAEERPKLGFWAEGQPELGPDEDYYGDDITSHGHGELEKHRELREYARLIAWELPLLNQLAKPFVLPDEKTPFRFRYTSYLGEKHPATNKVVVEFSPSDLPNLTKVQQNKLIKLAGVRYNPDLETVKMSCEKFDTLQQNKRFLGDTISALINEAKDGKDTFEDVPFDFRHHKPKVRHTFPEAWVITPERQKYLENKRAEALRIDEQKEVQGKLVDGERIVGNALPYMITQEEPVMVQAGKGKKQLR